MQPRQIKDAGVTLRDILEASKAIKFIQEGGEVTPQLLEQVRDPRLKQKLVEAICLRKAGG